MLCHTSERTAAVHGERRAPVHIRDHNHRRKTPNIVCADEILHQSLPLPIMASWAIFELPVRMR